MRGLCVQKEKVERQRHKVRCVCVLVCVCVCVLVCVCVCVLLADTVRRQLLWNDVRTVISFTSNSCRTCATVFSLSYTLTYNMY